MLISKTIFNFDVLLQIGSSIYGTHRTHDNDLVALGYMSDENIDPYDAIRESQFTSLVKYTFCWVIRPEQYYKYVDPAFETKLTKVVNDDNYVAYLCFFTANVKQWAEYCLDDLKPKGVRDEVRECLSKDGYSLLFKEVKLLK